MVNYNSNALDNFLTHAMWDECRKLLSETGNEECVLYLRDHRRGRWYDYERSTFATALKENAPGDIIKAIYDYSKERKVIVKGCVVTAAKYSNITTIHCLMSILQTLEDKTKRWGNTGLPRSLFMQSLSSVHQAICSRRSPEVYMAIFEYQKMSWSMWESFNPLIHLLLREWNKVYMNDDDFVGSNIDGSKNGIDQFRKLSKIILSSVLDTNVISTVHALFLLVVEKSKESIAQVEHISMLQHTNRNEFFTPDMHGNMLLHALCGGVKKHKRVFAWGTVRISDGRLKRKHGDLI